jgi:predicted HicB family RNase H-like nuclease
MKKNKTFNFRIHSEILDYLKIMADKNYTTVTGYIMDLIKKDMNKNVGYKGS